MRQLSAETLASLQGETTSFVNCVRVTRRDGIVVAFTDHNKDIRFDGTIFRASTAATPTVLQSETGLSPDTAEFSGGFESDQQRQDVRAGRLDGAKMEIFAVNWRDPSQRFIINAGHIGATSRNDTGFTLEFESLAEKTSALTGRVYNRTCDASLGDHRCRVNLSQWTIEATANNPAGGRSLRFTLFEPTPLESGLNDRSGNFSNGVLIFASGANEGLRFAIRAHSPGVIHLWEEPPFAVEHGDRLTLIAGCNKDFQTCADKFNNRHNFRGFPGIVDDSVLTELAPSAEDSRCEETTQSEFNAEQRRRQVESPGAEPDTGRVFVNPGGGTANMFDDDDTFTSYTGIIRRGGSNNNGGSRSEPDPDSPTGFSNNGVPTDSAGRVHGGI